MGVAVLNIVWFKRDLRVQDHAALARAAASGPVLPIYIAEPDLWAEPDASARQWAFAAECLAALGQPLRIFVGDAVAVLQAIASRHPIAALYSHEETGNGWTFARDRRVGLWAQQAGVPWHEARQTGVLRQLPARDGWAKKWDADMALPQTPAPTANPAGGQRACKPCTVS